MLDLRNEVVTGMLDHFALVDGRQLLEHSIQMDGISIATVSWIHHVWYRDYNSISHHFCVSRHSLFLFSMKSVGSGNCHILKMRIWSVHFVSFAEQGHCLTQWLPLHQLAVIIPAVRLCFSTTIFFFVWSLSQSMRPLYPTFQLTSFACNENESLLAIHHLLLQHKM